MDAVSEIPFAARLITDWGANVYRDVLSQGNTVCNCRQ